jgi:hypothetical protein
MPIVTWIVAGLGPLLGAALSFIFQTVVVKFVVFVAVYLLIVTAVPIVFAALSPVAFSGDGGIVSLLTGFMNDGMWYFWYYFRFDFGFPLMVAAMVGRFIMRRIPFLN